MTELGPRVVIAGTHSGVGKTTIATGLMAALRSRGHSVASAKVGPDFIDPGYHSVATRRPGRNLDAWICGPESMYALAGRAGRGADILVIEGVMGLFDGSVDPVADGRLATGSTAELAMLLDAPVILVVDVSAMSASVAALVNGFAHHHPAVHVHGVILNRVGSDVHEMLLRESLKQTGIDVVGALRRDDALTWRDRHLGLVPVAEQPQLVASSVARLATLVAQSCDLDAIVAIARRAPNRDVGEPPMPAYIGPARIAVAGGAAFSFCYPDNIEALAAAGAEIVPFDPLHDAALPQHLDAVFVGGGFPEEHAAALAANVSLIADVRARIATGLTVWAECGGLLWLSRALRDREGVLHELVGAVPAEGVMTPRLTLGYRTGIVAAASPLGRAGLTLRGHEFHYSRLEPGGGALALRSRFVQRDDGFASTRLIATYLHVHLGAAPQVAAAFVAATLGTRQ